MCGNNNNNNNNDIGMSYDQNLAVDIRHITDISFTFLRKQTDYSDCIKIAFQSNSS